MQRIVDALGKLDWGRACAVFALCASTAMALPAQTFTTLYSFCAQSRCTDGENPDAGIVQATDGNFYGTTFNGGNNDVGVVFKIAPNGTLTTLYSFCSQSGCTDGDRPSAGLVQAANGDFYGTTTDGGGASCPTYGCGTVFKITPNGTLTTLHTFCSQSQCTDGDNAYSEATLVQATDGDFYGMTDGGGENGNYGTIFKITPGGVLTTLYSFCSQSGCTDGQYPFSGLVQATNGDYYGTTYEGGANGAGTVFKITPGGSLTTVYSFCSQSGCTDGQYPYSGLVQATNGDFYGTTTAGGANCFRSSAGCGTIFKITLGGTLTTLHNFCVRRSCTDGIDPNAPMVQGTDGNLYGTTTAGGANAGGTIFQITPGGKLTTLYQCTDGSYPVTLVQATSGDFYGTTRYGGANGEGAVFSLSVGLSPFVKTQTVSGKVGAPVTILGNDLTGASSVTFNGTAAVFTVNATGTAISTTVPVGATTGTVQVVTPSSTLSSNVPFRVLP
jgi:uncharacterized repeat protein (TIGR03803 family)